MLSLKKRSLHHIRLQVSRSKDDVPNVLEFDSENMQVIQIMIFHYIVYIITKAHPFRTRSTHFSL